MSLEAWNTDPEREDMGLLAHMKEDVINPLLSAPVIFQTGTVKAAEYVGSRSKIEIERVKMITKTIIDAETRARTYGSGNEWKKWVHDNVLHMNGTPIYKEILVNLPSGITVALVNLPLSISLGIAADATPAMGCITAVWSGLSAGALGGSHYNIVGPTGALSGILSKASVRYGEEVLPLLAIITGFICIGVFALKLDQCAQFVPLCVMQGFSVGVAIIICVNQLNFALGLPKLPRHELLVDNVMEQLSHIELCEWQAVVIFVAFFFGQLVLSTVLPKIRGIAIPWAVIMAAIGMICGYLSSEGIIGYRIQTLSTRYPSFGGANLIQPPVFHHELFTPQCGASAAAEGEGGGEHATAPSDGLDAGSCGSAAAVFLTCIDFFQASLSIAFVAVLETLISAKIAAKMTKTKFNQRKEVLSIGLANIFSGALGGIPATAALARTALNIKSGAKSRMSSLLGGLILIILLSALLPAFKYLPLPCVASILCNVAYRMLEIDELKHIFHVDKGQFLLLLFVAVISIIEDPTVGIVFGWIFSMLRTAMFLSKAHAKCFVRQGSTVITTFYTEIMTTDKVMPPFMFRRQIRLTTPDEVQECFVFNAAHAPCATREIVTHDGEVVPVDISQVEDAWEQVCRLGVSTDDSDYKVVVHYVILGHLSFITCATHQRRVTNVPADVILIDLSDISGIDVDGQIALEELVYELEGHKKVVFLMGLSRQSDELRHILEHTKLTARLRAKSRVIDTYSSGMERFRFASGDVVSQGTMNLKQELLIDPQQRIDLMSKGLMPRIRAPGARTVSTRSLAMSEESESKRDGSRHAAHKGAELTELGGGDVGGGDVGGGDVGAHEGLNGVDSGAEGVASPKEKKAKKEGKKGGKKEKKEGGKKPKKDRASADGAAGEQAEAEAADADADADGDGNGNAN